MSAFSPEKRSWFISLILSVIYFFTFLAAAGKVFEDNLLFGFCVWGTPELPNKDLGCSESPINSHIIAFCIDVVMALSSVWFYMKDPAAKKGIIMYIAIAAIILSHGSLHFLISSPTINCYTVVDHELEEKGYTLFAIFTFFLCLIILGFAFNFSTNILIGSGVFTGIVVFITQTIGNGEYTLPAMFCIVHPLSSFAGLFTKGTNFTSTVGWWFVVATSVGILELATCAELFRKIGGHFLYDLTLHTSMLFSLPYFTRKAEDNKKKN